MKEIHNAKYNRLSTNSGRRLEISSGFQGGRLHASRLSPASQAESTIALNARLNPNFAFVRNDYRVRLVEEASPLHTKVNDLITGMYGARGLITTTATSTQTTAPQRLTLAASSGHRVFGTLTLGMDTGQGLMADELYKNEIDELRARGRRLCEVTRLAFEPALSCQEVMATIFNVAFVLARDVHARTDLVAEVHPRHAAFYRRAMGYQVVGPVRMCPRVSAPAVLLHLCLDFARSQIRKLAGSETSSERSLYRFFLPAAEQKTLLSKLTDTAVNS
ncbi:MAG: hypothetical protein WC997_06285 [Porticoccaceae bacterium]